MPDVKGIPILNGQPLTTDPIKNVGIAAGVVGATQGAMYAATAQMNGPLPAVAATSVFLNLVIQPLKKVKWIPEHEFAVIFGLLVSFAVGYFLLYHGDTAQSFVNSAMSTFQAIVNYKGDKASGMNILPPTPAHLEFGARHGPTP